MATSLNFDDKHFEIITKATYVCSWPQSALQQKAALTATAEAEYRSEAAHLEELQVRANVATQRLQDELSDHTAVLQAFTAAQVADQKRTDDAQAQLVECLAELERRKASYADDQLALDADHATREATRVRTFNTDTERYNTMNTTMENAELHCDSQSRLVKEKKHHYDGVRETSDQAQYSVDQMKERLGNKLIALLNSYPSSTWIMERRGGDEGKTRDISDSVVRVITTMLVNPKKMYKKDIYASINRSSKNHESPVLFDVCEDLNIMYKSKANSGGFLYSLHRSFLAQLNFEPRSRKFQKIQRWHFSRKNRFLETEEEREEEYLARK